MFKKFAVFCLLVVLSTNLYSEYTVADVIDGDSIIIRNKTKTIKFQLYGVDAPDMYQEFNIESAKWLREKILNKKIDYKVVRYDEINSIVVGEIILNNENINEKIIKEGYAWARQDSPNIFYDLQEKARKDKIGLWQQENPIAPWEFRYKYKNSNPNSNFIGYIKK